MGDFDTSDKILVIYKEGAYEITNFELTNRYEQEKILKISKLNADTVVSAVHFEGKQNIFL